jgi:hypothetical protein
LSPLTPRNTEDFATGGAREPQGQLQRPIENHKMNNPRRHHYVPQFHQKRFADSGGRFWVWDKITDRIFQSTQGSIAVESDFYRLHEFEKQGRDPFVMEKQLSDMEGQMSLITEQWLGWLRNIEPGDQIPIPKPNREVVSRFMAVQFLRTADTRDILCAMYDEEHPDEPLSAEERTKLHTELIWDLDTVERIANHIREAIWVFARNGTSTPFITSDNPVAFRTKDNAMWLKVGFVTEGSYAVYPLSPDMVMFCHEREYWKAVEKLDGCLSPFQLTDEMVESENTGQIFMASRFVISSINDFESLKEFAKTIGTETYAR